MAKEIASRYNNKRHCVTKHTPFEVYHSTSKKLHATVYVNIESYYAKKIQENNQQLAVGDKMAIAENIKVDIKGFIKEQARWQAKKGDTFHTLATIINALDFGFVKILIDLTRHTDL